MLKEVKIIDMEKTGTVDKNIFILGDSVAELKKMPSRSVDLIILDPPYWKVISEKWDYQWRTKSDYAKWAEEWINEVGRVVKLSGSVFIFGYLRNLIYLYPMFGEAGFEFKQEIIVDKGKRSLGGRATKGYKSFPNVTETIWHFHFDSKPYIKKFLKKRQKELGLSSLQINTALGVKINGGGVWSLYTGNNILAQVPTKEMWRRLEQVLDFKMPYENIGKVFNIELGVTNVWTDIDFYKEKRIHSTQKPVKLIERLIKATTNEGATVLDPFAGSGATCIACLNSNRSYYAVELDEDYFKKATTRISNHKPVLKLPLD